MRNIYLAAILAFAVMAHAAHAEEKIVRELPGNVTIATDPDRGPHGVIIYNDDDSVLYRALVGRRDRNVNIPGTASLEDVNSICGNARTTSDRNRCTRDVIKEREKLQKRYN